MNETAQALKERIKELRCLYEVSSILVNANVEIIDDTLKAIAYSLKNSFQQPDETVIAIAYDTISICTDKPLNNTFQMHSDILIFNEVKGQVIAHLKSSEIKKNKFLEEEQLLLDNVALKIGNLLERIEIQKNETSLKRQMERADRLGILGEITAGIAHELNTPLTNILGFAELLKSNLEEEKKATNDLDKIIQNAIFSREVVKKLMFFACEMPQEMKLINMVPHIKNAINLLDASFRKEQVKYIVKIDAETLWLRADSIQLIQIIFNLLINAIYFSPKNGLVTIEAFQTKNDIVLKISDEGIGFTEEAKHKLFQPFFTTKPIGEGSGLGLSVVYGIITSHKGTIIAENKPDKGALFTVTFPKI